MQEHERAGPTTRHTGTNRKDSGNYPLRTYVELAPADAIGEIWPAYEAGENPHELWGDES